ncbi:MULTISPECIES: SMI1/KNR4 family protein [Streptomyces]|uniref:SMI1/KNR4 family protein n=1 Tax=Streptomyces TaxID=1883 RepID=UPI0016776FA5|nr:MULTISPECIES: SMI1/KNR4 family protein [Streptomyces]MBD3578066.1 SMI1/KNR4 family protein [Streptomyces sp. KD18]
MPRSTRRAHHRIPVSPRRLVPPPAEPVGAHGDRGAVGHSLGVRLPADYRALVETYGRGDFCDHLCLHTPFSAERHHPYLLYRDPRGLLVWGTTIDADRLCWETTGDSRHWPVVLWSHDGAYETFGAGAAGFVERWVGGSLGSRLLGPPEPDLTPWFTAARHCLHRCLALSQGPPPHAERLRTLRAALAPTVDRGSWRAEDGRTGQDHFTSVDTDWQLTYDMSEPHQIRVAYPPEDAARAEDELMLAVRLMGCEVLALTDAGGMPAATWNASTAEDLEPA